MAEKRMIDKHGQQVHQFEQRMRNLGFQRMGDEIIKMLRSKVWCSWDDGLGHVELLPGEFDYFLSACGVTREMVMTGIRDMEIKAELEKYMDERRTGEEGYRRRYLEIKTAMGNRRTWEPFGLTEREAKALNGKTRADGAVLGKREALGKSARRFAASGGKERRAPSDRRSKVERLQASVANLSEKEFKQFSDWLALHRRERRRVK